MINSIIVKDLEVDCIIGIHEWERNRAQKLYIDIRAYFDFSPVIESHAFKDTVDYVKVARLASDIAKKGNYKLLEALGNDIANALFEKFPIVNLEIDFKKPTPDVANAQYVGVSFRLGRNRPAPTHETQTSFTPSKTAKLYGDRIALITGSAKGLGKALALHLGNLGCTVGIHYRNSHAEAQEIVDQLRKSDIKAEAFQGDLSKPKETRAMAERFLETFGKIDFLINNVGAYTHKPLYDTDPEEFDHILSTNISGTFGLIREVLPTMRRHRFGRIINIGQSAAERIRAFKTETPYQISKTGILILTKSIAALEAQNGITCNVVAPGVLENNTYFTPNLYESIPMGRLGTFEDIAAAVDFLLSPGADYITGGALDVSGGFAL